MVDVLASPIFRDEFLRGLAQSVWRGQETTDNITDKIKILIDNRLWEQTRINADNGETIFPFESFAAFVAAPLEQGGLNTSIDKLKKLCRDDVVALDAIDRAIQFTPGRPRLNHDNVMIKASQGNNTDYSLRRLRKNRPDLYERILLGEMSTNAAMIEAGFRKKTATVQLTDAAKAAKTLKANMSPEVLEQLIDLLRTDEDKND